VILIVHETYLWRDKGSTLHTTYLNIFTHEKLRDSPPCVHTKLRYCVVHSSRLFAGGNPAAATSHTSWVISGMRSSLVVPDMPFIHDALGLVFTGHPERNAKLQAGCGVILHRTREPARTLRANQGIFRQASFMPTFLHTTMR
jgi:hypothetical protein